MANSTTGNVWKIDTAGVITTQQVYVHRFVWTPTTDGDDISIVDNGANELWTYKAIAADSNQAIGYTREFGEIANGINVATLDHGTLYIYLK